MWEEIVMSLNEYLWLFAGVASMSFMNYCRDRMVILTEPDHYYWFGMATAWLIHHLYNMPVG